MTRRVEKYDAPRFIRIVRTGNFNAVSADVLRNAAGLAGHHVGRANRIQQGSLAVIDVSHHRDYGRARNFHVVGVGRD